jgi:hypothetical protein
MKFFGQVFRLTVPVSDFVPSDACFWLEIRKDCSDTFLRPCYVCFILNVSNLYRVCSKRYKYISSCNESESVFLCVFFLHC